jgi:histidinol-phosphate aminotransferase
MMKSRRDFLRSFTVGAAAGAAAGWQLNNIPAAYAVEPDRTRQGDGFILLNSNENAYGPSPRVASAISSATRMANRYAFRKNDEVTERIARLHQVKPEQVLFACGSSEILRVAACAFLGAGRQLIQALPTFESLEHYAKSAGSEVVSVPLDRTFAHDLDRMLARADASTGLVYICNPNNPTASLTPRKDLESFIAKLPATSQVLIDEAYHHFVVRTGMYGSFIDTPLNDDRVIVTRTFSKVYGLAGLRLGYAVASPKMIEKMRAFVTEDSLNSIVAEVVGVALDDVKGVAESVRRNRDDRQEFLNAANIRNLKPIDPHANFAMVDVDHPAVDVIEHFRKHNILIGRHFPPMDNYIRVSFGIPGEMQAFWQTWDLLPWSKNMMRH